MCLVGFLGNVKTGFFSLGFASAKKAGFEVPQTPIRYINSYFFLLAVALTCPLADLWRSF